LICEPAFKRELPVIGVSGGKLSYSDGNAFLYNKTGDITWKYEGAKHTGVGIVGCTRSATQYMSKVLHKIGLNVGHEYQGPDGSVGYHLAIIRPDGCLHQVRHPLKQISSNIAHSSWGFIGQVIDLPNTKLLGCMQYWLMWNKMCEDFCVWRYQIEQLPEVWDEFLSRIKHEPCELPSVPKDTNSHYKQADFKQYSWDDLFNEDRQIAQDILDTAKRYGYDTPEMDKVECQNLREPEKAEVASV
jgi:hypothetical protein